jgi:NADH:ubiquinone reductase (H+-translocating)
MPEGKPAAQPIPLHESALSFYAHVTNQKSRSSYLMTNDRRLKELIMLNHKIVVLGAGYAGMMAAYRLAGTTNAQITLINASDVFVERIRLHQQAAGQQLKRRSLVDLLRGTRINFVQGKVIALYPEQHTIEVETATGIETVAYDKLVYALGSSTERDKVPGVREYTFGVTPDEVATLHTKLASAPNGTQLIVCGSGLTGIESATELAESYPHVHVTLVTRDQFAEQFSRKGQAYIRQMFERMNITVLDNTTIQHVERNAVIAADQTIPFDFCLWAGSMTPPAIARKAGLTTNVIGQILVNEYMQSVSHPDIYAAGDAAIPEKFPFAIRMTCAAAMPMGGHAASSISAALRGKAPKPFTFSYFVWCVSLGRKAGIVQVVDAEDKPQEQIFTGWFAAMIKEIICRGTVMVIKWERRLPGLFAIPNRRPTVARVMQQDHGRI